MRREKDVMEKGLRNSKKAGSIQACPIKYPIPNLRDFYVSLEVSETCFIFLLDKVCRAFYPPTK